MGPLLLALVLSATATPSPSLTSLEVDAKRALDTCVEDYELQELDLQVLTASLAEARAKVHEKQVELDFPEPKVADEASPLDSWPWLVVAGVVGVLAGGLGVVLLEKSRVIP